MRNREELCQLIQERTSFSVGYSLSLGSFERIEKSISVAKETLRNNSSKKTLPTPIVGPQKKSKPQKGTLEEEIADLEKSERKLHNTIAYAYEKIDTTALEIAYKNNNQHLLVGLYNSSSSDDYVEESDEEFLPSPKSQENIINSFEKPSLTEKNIELLAQLDQIKEKAQESEQLQKEVATLQKKVDALKKTLSSKQRITQNTLNYYTLLSVMQEYGVCSLKELKEMIQEMYLTKRHINEPKDHEITGCDLSIGSYKLQCYTDTKNTFHMSINGVDVSNWF